MEPQPTNAIVQLDNVCAIKESVDTSVTNVLEDILVLHHIVVLVESVSITGT